MAFLLEPISKTYDDKPLTDFPVQEDVFERMMDITIGLAPLVQQYNSYYAAGNLSGCNTLLANNPELKSCLFNAEKYNRLQDAILAMEEFLLTQVDALYNTVSQHAVGINDQPSEEEASLVAYSAEKINQLLGQLKNHYHTARNVSIPALGWSDEYPYTNTVPLDWAKNGQDIRVVGVHIPEGSTLEEVKSWNKYAGFLMEHGDGVQDGSITFQAYKKPTVDFTVIVQGG